MLKLIDRMELPQWYDENKMVLLVVDPYTVYLYWQLAFSQCKAIKEHQQVLRLFELPPEQLAHEQPGLLNSILLPAFTDNWYFNELKPGCRYQADMGWEQNGVFYSIIKSNTVNMPPAAPSATTSQAKWRPVEHLQETAIIPAALPTQTVKELIQQMSFYMGINEAS
ncbi:DUF4912 domain-containing protein [Desulfoscipio sp. XC116]|uniref:DUF4912 domain-containing protein n=1 Tax=Desulfoscipio sp. XC116 TaxID=3144975 RepID=UPI00325BFEE8